MRENLENHATDLEHSQKLKDAGIEFESIYDWAYNLSEGLFLRISKNYFDEYLNTKKMYNAYLATELLEKIPTCLGQHYRIIISRADGLYRMGYMSAEGYFKDNFSVTCRNFCNALADLLIWVKEENSDEVH